MKNYVQENISKIHKKFSRLAHVVSDDMAMVILERTANDILEWIQSKSYSYQDQTYNLTDSTGCAIYQGGRLIRTFFNPKRATTERMFYDAGARISVNGRALLDEAVNSTNIATIGQYTLGVFSAAPYGIYVEIGNGKRGTGWFSDLANYSHQVFKQHFYEYLASKRNSKRS